MRVIPRDEWLDIPRGRPGSIPVPQPRRWLHHGASGTSSVNTARAYARYHMLTLGWSDIGYSFIIAAGKVLEGRGPTTVGAHTRGQNATSHGICMAGNYMVQTPAPRDVDALVWLLNHGVAQGWWELPVLTGGHRDAPGHDGNLCPGANLYELIPTINDRRPEDDDMYVIRADDSGPRVARAQRVIRAAGVKAGMGDLLPVYGADGHYGSETVGAVDRLAARAGLDEDGDVGMDVLVLDYCRNWLSGS